ncbi:MAG: hypothetical protein PUC37_01685 [Spirochaetales bacterium]|nr:hypothetical protein [Spirochaetales bacterium]
MNVHKIIPYLSCFLLVIMLCSCKMRAEHNSLSNQFETIDSLISQNQMSSAIKELKKAEKQAYDSWSYIGIYRRYKLLGETELSSKLLKKALKKHSQNQELNAVYTEFLIKNKNLTEAKKYAEKLKDSKYASLYSEIILTELLESEKKNEPYDYFSDTTLYNIYLDAWKTSKNTLWLRNCAVLNVCRGQYGIAANLNPGFYSDADDAYFWGQVLYDAGNFYDSIAALDYSSKALNDFSLKSVFKTTEVMVAALESDAYMAVSQIEDAERIRQQLIFNTEEKQLNSSDEKILSIIYANSAIWAMNQGLTDRGVDLLFKAVNRWPEFVPTLILYTDFAYSSNLEREEDDEIKALRKAGISTLEMEKYDNRRKVPLSDAIYRIDRAIDKTQDPYLNIAKLDLRYKTDKSVTEKEKISDLWKMLEAAYTDNEQYRTLLIQYAMHFLLQIKKYDDAWELFFDFVTDYGTYSPKRDFWEQFIEQKNLYDLSFVEFAAYFACEQKLYEETLRLYEYCVYESGGILMDGAVSQKASTAACMNLADIYFSTGKKDKALDLYGRAAGRESNNKIRSEIFYRIACIYTSTGENKNALRSLEYAISMNPENERASLLRTQLLALNY